MGTVERHFRRIIMLKTKMKQLITAVAISSAVAFTPASVQAAEGASAIEQGKKLAFSRSKGNCLACHWIQGGTLPGTSGPGLIMMKARFKDKQVLRDKIWGKLDTQVKDSMMPPFGQNGILSEKEIDLITDYIYSL